MSRIDRKIKKHVDLYNRFKRNFESVLKICGKDLSDGQKKEALTKFKQQYAQSIIESPKKKGFASNVVNLLAKKAAWDNKIENKLIDKFKGIIPTQVDDAIINAGMKVNNWTVNTAVSGLESLAKRLDRTKENQEAAERAAEEILHNHNEWYLRFKGDNLAPLNYFDAVDEWVEFNRDNVKGLTPQVIRIPIQLVLPSESKHLARLKQAFTGNLTSLLNARGYGYNEYSDKDVANFIDNTRKAIALLALACRQIKVYNNYNTLNVLQPDLLIAAHDTNYYTTPIIQSERSILTSLRERVRLAIEQLKTITAGSCPLYDRTLFLLSNFFKDSKSNKACYYVFDLDRDNEDGIFTYVYHEGASNSLTTVTVSGTNITSVSDILDTFDTIMQNCFINDYKAKQIRSDINYLYGITGSTHYTTYFEKVYASLDEPLKYSSDEKILLQIHNMRLNNRMQEQVSASGNHASYVYFNGQTVSTIIPFLPLDSEVDGTINTTVNLCYRKVNAWKKLSADDLVSVTRLLNFYEGNHKITLQSDLDDPAVIAMKVESISNLHCGKFENPIMVQYITYNTLYNGSNAQFVTKPLLAPGNVMMPIIYDRNTAKFLDYESDMCKWAWSYADWMPHAKINLTADTSNSADHDYVISHVTINSNYRIMHDLDMCADITSEQLYTIDECAMLSELIWAQNGSNIIDTTFVKRARNSKSSKSYKADK